jgi:rhomboid protease GluP
MNALSCSFMAKCSSCGRDIGFSFGKKLCPWCVEHERAKQGEDGEYQRVMPTPWTRGRAASGPSFTHLFIAVCALVYAATLATGIPINFWGANFGPFTLRGQPWRLVTYMFLHGGLFHIAFNMWCLWDLGALAESLYGDWLYAVAYILCGIGGGLFTLAWHPGMPTVGASGAIFGIAGALIASLKLGEFTLPRAALSGVMRSVIGFVGFNVVLGAFAAGTDNACHIGGLLTGLLFGALVAVIAPDRNQVGRRLAILAAIALLLYGAWLLIAHRTF